MMNKVFPKRIFRDLKENFPRWLALFLMIVMGMYIVTSVVGAAETIITQSNRAAAENQVEDGEFTTFLPMTEEQEKILEDAGVILERKFSVDVPLEDGSMLRLMQNREEINLITIDEGQPANEKGEIVLEKRYCEEHGYAVGDKIGMSGHALTVVGIGTTPDYDLPIGSLSDMAAESTLFGTAFVTKEQYGEMVRDDGMRSEDYTYAYRLKEGKSEEDVKRELKAFIPEQKRKEMLTAFVTADRNPRILAAAGDMVMNKEMGMIAGVVVLALFAYVISVFVIHQINREAAVIGTLYALGVKKKEILTHYITLPLLVTSFGGVTGAALGFSKLGAARQMREAYGYFSIPAFTMLCPAYLVVYAAVVPPILSIIVNFFALNRRLSQTALSMMRNEQKASKLHQVKLKGTHFVRNFRIRQTLRELRASITVIVGLFVSLLVFMLGLNCYVLCKNAARDSVGSVKFAYSYLLKYPQEQIPEGAQSCYSESLSKTEQGFTLDVSVIGIDADNRYFKAKPSERENSVVIGRSVATKYGLKEGDSMTLTDNAAEKDYVFTVEGVCDYAVGLTVFMDIDAMRFLFGRESGYYNMLLADEPLAIDGGRLYAVTSRTDIERSAAIFTKMMTPMITMILAVSVIIFFMVMYLMAGVMVSRASFGISLIKIFGFRTTEIRSLYLDGGVLTVAAGALVSILPAKRAIDMVYPHAVANVSCGLNLRFSWYFYPLIFTGIVLVYLIVIALQTRKISKISPMEVLKTRE